MNSEKQIEEINSLTSVIWEANHKKSVLDYHWLATEVYNAGYRKQSEGEWIEHIEKPSWMEDDVEVYYNCSVCGTSHWSIAPPFCPNCGAKMKGGA